jgi:hypothetical protein
MSKRAILFQFMKTGIAIMPIWTFYTIFANEMNCPHQSYIKISILLSKILFIIHDDNTFTDE